MTFTEIKIDSLGISYENHAACMVIEVALCEQYSSVSFELHAMLDVLQVIVFLDIKLKLVKFNKEKMVWTEACLLGFIVVSVYNSKNKGDTFDKRDVSSTY